MPPDIDREEKEGGKGKGVIDWLGNVRKCIEEGGGHDVAAVLEWVRVRQIAGRSVELAEEDGWNDVTPQGGTQLGGSICRVSADRYHL